MKVVSHKEFRMESWWIQDGGGRVFVSSGWSLDVFRVESWWVEVGVFVRSGWSLGENKVGI